MENKKDKKDSESIFDFLPGAEKGKVITRFAPEPSGYLHIGHVKAAMLCYYAAKHFSGKMILRFDDTNPSKEKGEFLESIKADLKKLEIVPDIVSYSSDHFPKLRELMTELIKKGKAYCDDIEPAKMKEDRMNGIKSAKRDTSIEENLKIWKQMIGENPSSEIKKYCIRGKIDYQNANKCLRDPVFYRFTEEKHDRLPDNYHLFPCYDFACPCIDAIEGVTHAMRANEYSDRIPMYEWVQDSLNLRKVNIYEFSRLNLIQTVLSKRYLKWFVETGRVEGWDDPRFPTVQGIIRRGLLPQALKDFCLEQGASKKTNLMEWDKIYAIIFN
jgi:glutamyl-tRNA synthetase